MVFAGVGFVSLPMSLIRAFVGRPRSTIPRSEYVTRAMALQARAVQIKVRSWCGITYFTPQPIMLCHTAVSVLSASQVNEVRGSSLDPLRCGQCR